MNIRQTLWVAIWAVGIAGCAKGPPRIRCPRRQACRCGGQPLDPFPDEGSVPLQRPHRPASDHDPVLRTELRKFLPQPALVVARRQRRQTYRGRDYFYSTMERGNTSKAASFGGDSYGIEFKLYHLSRQRELRRGRVMYVVEGSPARRAGIRRGDWIRQVNGNDISFGSTNVLVRGGQTRMLVQRIAYSVPGLVYDVTWEKEVVVDAAEPGLPTTRF